MIIIKRNGIELPFISETLVLKSKNSVFSDSLSLEYSKHPFLVLENEETVKALGSRHIMSLTKKKEYEVTVFRDNKIYFGKLIVKSYLLGARKCDLVFGSEILKILNKKIKEFMPTVYLGKQIPYSDKVDEEIVQTDLVDKLALHEKKKYPEVDFQFPEILAPNFVKKEKNWKDYSERINRRDANGKLELNFQNKLLNNYIFIGNINVFTPFVYLLKIFFYIFQSIDFKVEGSVFEDVFMKNLMLSTLEKNTSFFKVRFSGKEYFLDSRKKDGYGYYFSLHIPNESITFGERGADVYIKIPKPNNVNEVFSLSIYFAGGKYTGDPFILKKIKYSEFVDDFYIVNEVLFFEKKKDRTVSFTVVLRSTYASLPIESSVIIFEKQDKVDKALFHSTIDLGRFVPNWSVLEFINHCKKLFNLKIIINDSLKNVIFDFVPDYLNDGDFVDLSNYNLSVKNYKNNDFNTFKISYANEQPVFIDEEGIRLNSVSEKGVVDLTNGFSNLHFDNATPVLKNDDSTDEIILLLNDEGKSTPVKEINGKSLDMNGNGGIAKTHWLDWVQFRSKSSSITLVGEIYKHDLIRIEQLKKVYYNNIMFLVEEISTKKKNDFTETTLQLQSKVF